MMGSFSRRRWDDGFTIAAATSAAEATWAEKIPVWLAMLVSRERDIALPARAWVAFTKKRAKSSFKSIMMIVCDRRTFECSAKNIKGNVKIRKFNLSFLSSQSEVNVNFLHR